MASRLIRSIFARSLALGGSFVLICAALTGCGDLVLATKLATYSSDNRSFVQGENEKITVAVSGPQTTQQVKADNTDFSIDDRISRFCLSQDVSNPPKEGTYQTQAVGAGITVLVAAATIVYGEVKNDIDYYIDEKVKEFTQSYDSTITLPEANFSKTGVRCIKMSRKIKLKEYGEVDAMTLVIGIYPRGGGYVFRPIYVDIPYAKARTSKSSGAVDLAITIGVSSVQRNPIDPQRMEFLPLTQQNITLRKVPLSQRNSGADGDKSAKKYFDDIDIFNDVSYDSALFMPLPPMPRESATATFAVAVTEVGAGANNFKALKEAVDRNSATVSGALGSVIEKHYAK